MTLEEIIQDEAKEFTRKYDILQRKNEGHIELKNELQIALCNYNDKTDKLIYLYEIHNITVTKYQKHYNSANQSPLHQNCSQCKFYEKSIYFIEQEIKELNSSFHFTILRPEVDSALINKNLLSLKNLPEVARLYESALTKLNEGNLNRNLLDDLRLAFELFLKEIFKNEKSLENQISDLGEYLKSSNNSPELTNMITKLIDYYAKYQNKYIKHNDKVKESEVSLVLNLTSSFINFLLNNNT
jgi:hypothetical protein